MTDDDAPAAPTASGPRIGRVAALVAATTLVVGAAAVAASQRSDGSGDGATVATADAGWHGALLSEPLPRPDFTLTDTSGRPYDFAAETGGRLTLLFFGYTSCPDICPIHMATLSAALEQPGMPDPVVVFVTTDPARDTPERLRSWLDNFGTDYVGLTGSPEQIAAAEDAAGIARSVVPADGATDEDYEVGHAAQIIAYTPDDRAHLQYPFGVRRQDWEADLPRMLDEWGAPPLSVGEAWAAADDSITAVYLTIRNDGPGDQLVAVGSDVADEVSVMGAGVPMDTGGDEAATAGSGDATGGAAAGSAASGGGHSSHGGTGGNGGEVADSPVDLAVPEGVTELAPGGTHLMLGPLTRPLVPGERITVRLTFATAGVIDVPVDILDWDQVAERAGAR